ncbi:MAG: hypothetical protein AAF492_16505, partial [Verrucomicrobiota bacterium]
MKDRERQKEKAESETVVKTVRKILLGRIDFHHRRFKWVGLLFLGMFGLTTVVYSRAMSWDGNEVKFWQGWPMDWLNVTLQYPINEPFGLDVVRSIR